MSNDLSAFFGGTPFTPETIEPTTDFDVIPPGKYLALIETAEVKPTRAGNGHIIKLMMQILDGKYKGRKLFDNINIDNPNEQCVEIGMRTLSALGRALNLAVITDTAQLVGGIVVVHVKVQNEQNNVRTYSESTPATTQPTQPSPQQQAPSVAPPQQAPPVTPSQQVALTNGMAQSTPPWQR